MTDIDPQTAAKFAGALAADKPMTKLRMDILNRKIAKAERRAKRYRDLVRASK